jgi:hypothetical protein
MARRAALIVACFLVVACAGQTSPAPASPGPSTTSIVGIASAGASPSSTPDQEAIRKTAASAYAAAAKATNAAETKLDKKYPSSMSLRQAHAYYAALAKIDGTFIVAIRKIAVPVDTAADMHTLIVRETAAQAIFLEASKARASDLTAMANDLTKAARNASAAANQIRSDLGLPPVQY